MKRAFTLVASSARKLRAERGKIDPVSIETKPRARHREPVVSGGCSELQRLFTALSRVQPATNPRTYRLLDSGDRKIAQKVIEEAGEVALEAVKHRAIGVVRESADLLYHLVALWRRVGVDPGEVWNEMQRRADTLGIAEKLPKPPARTPKPSKS